jgi:hypothetical protein
MPGKSKHGKGKHQYRGKKGRAKYRHATMAPNQPVVADTAAPAATTGIPPSASMPTSPKSLRVVQYPYITGELRRIGILAGIILVILIVLALVLS